MRPAASDGLKTYMKCGSCPRVVAEVVGNDTQLPFSEYVSDILLWAFYQGCSEHVSWCLFMKYTGQLVAKALTVY